MADLSTLRTLIVLTTFITVAFGLYAFAASESTVFFADTMTDTRPNQGQSVDPKALLAWNASNVATISHDVQIDDYNFEGFSYLKFEAVYDENASWYILIETYDSYGGFETNFEDFTWYNSTGKEISVRRDIQGGRFWGGSSSHIVMPVNYYDWTMYRPGTLDYIYGYTGSGEAGYNPNLANLNFTLTNGKGSMDIKIGFDEDAFAIPSDALDGTGLVFSLKQDFSDRRTTLNILTFIGGLFLMDAPGVPSQIDWLLSIIWYGSLAALVYIIFSIVRSLIPFLPGG